MLEQDEQSTFVIQLLTTRLAKTQSNPSLTISITIIAIIKVVNVNHQVEEDLVNSLLDVLEMEDRVSRKLIKVTNLITISTIIGSEMQYGQKTFPLPVIIRISRMKRSAAIRS